MCATGFLLTLVWSLVCQHAAGSRLNVTEQEQNMPIRRTLNTPVTKMFSSGVDYEKTEEEDVKEVIAPQFLVGDSGKVESKLKKTSKSESGKKNPNKPKRKGNNKGKKNKKRTRTPCEGEFKNFCVHGECKYIEHLTTVTCRCHLNYFGERCVEQFLKTRNSDGSTSLSTTGLVVVVVLVLLVLGFVAIVITVLVPGRKKCPKYDEKEERKKLRQDGSSSNDV
ncbi:amphiregulin [Rhineura floridana]|uniref:amphiregulin n=1 Tax=Rhineura floridana TaxID=261503 RepID=UPI002AC8920E|nr:amphiregulin [Rhineura floridana]